MIVDDASASMEDHHRREWSRALRSIELGLRAAVGAADFAGVKSKRYIRPGCNTRNGNDQQKGAESEADHASILAKTSGSSRPGSQAHRRLGDKPLERVPLTRNHVIAGGAPLEGRASRMPRVASARRRPEREPADDRAVVRRVHD